jgi:hypothetical protein
MISLCLPSGGTGGEPRDGLFCIAIDDGNPVSTNSDFNGSNPGGLALFHSLRQRDANDTRM